jgi:thiol:disulfide interchange protein DsbD
MKKLLLLAVMAVCGVVHVLAQQAITWKVTGTPKDSTHYTITAKGTLANSWHLYGSNPGVEGLEAPTKFTTELTGANWQGVVEYTGQSSNLKDPLFENKAVQVYTGELTVQQTLEVPGNAPAAIRIIIEGFAGKNDELQSLSDTVLVTLKEGSTANNPILKPDIDIQHTLSNCGDANIADKSLVTIFFLGFVGGLVALLTPCVFPMVPVTVSFFTKSSSTRQQAIKNGSLYGFFILLIYLLASVPFHILGNVQPEVFNNLSTNAWLNLTFFAVFIIFAISFFGYFDITLPSSVAGKADSKSGLTSVSGIFFMALTLVIVSFSCTGVILGSLLAGTVSNGAWPLTVGMAGFGVALGLPFALFAIFPHWLQSLPKSGGWLDTVKKVLAFVEVALALKFLSNADLVKHWGLLKREVFIGIWILIAFAMALYLFGLLRLPHDNKGDKIGTGRKITGVIALLFGLYLVPGLTNTKYANLRLLSGFPPPLHYSLYHPHKALSSGVTANVVNNYEQALALSRQQHKPLLIDFTGWACVNCRKMEEQVWTVQEVSDYIKQNFILVSLYVDDRKALPANEVIFGYKTKDGKQKDIVTVGDKWATFQTENFNQNSQPLYAVLNGSQKLMSHPVGYTPDVKEYLAWLKCSKETFNKHPQ